MEIAELSKLYSSGIRDFSNLDFSRANLSWMNLSGACFQGADLSWVNFSGADLVKTDFSKGANLTFANLSRADLTDADLRGAILDEANLEDTVLNNALYDSKTKFPSGFDPATSGAVTFETKTTGNTQSVVKSQVNEISKPSVLKEEPSAAIPLPPKRVNELIEIYNDNPDILLNGFDNVTQVVETTDSFEKRWIDSSYVQVDLEKSTGSDFWIVNISSDQEQWLIPKPRLRLFSIDNVFTFKSLFSYKCKLIPHKRMILVKPARVRDTSNGWQLVDKGEVEFEGLLELDQSSNNTKQNYQVKLRKETVEPSSVDKPALKHQTLLSNTSGQGSNSIVPLSVKGWNWGAFFFPGLWCLPNRVWIGLLSWMPYFGWVMAFVLGARGNEMAWKNRKWKSIDEFKSHQRTWAITGFSVYGLLFLLILAAGSS